MQVYFNPPPKDFINTEDSLLFQQLEFHKTNYKVPEYQFLFKEGGNSNSIFFHAEDDYLVSTARSSFGGFARNSVFQAEMLKEAQSFLPKQQKLKIVNAPLCYGFLNEGLIESASEVKKETNQAILLENWEETALSDNRRKVLKKSIKSGFTFKEVGVELLEQVYSIIHLNRSRKGFPTTMSFLQLQKVVCAFPEYYRLFVVSDSLGNLLSSAVVIKINADISYLFYLGSGPQELSGNTYMVHQLIKLLQKEQYKLFDLGISSVNGEMNDGLFRFKEGFGSTVSNKLTLIY